MADRFPSLDKIDSDAADIISSDIDGAATGLSLLEREKAILPDGEFADIPDGDYDPDASKFDQEFPDIMEQPNMTVGGTIADNTGPYVPGMAGTLPQTPSVPFADEEDEPEILKEWRRRRDEAIALRDAASAEKKARVVEEAKQAIDDFYTNYNVTKERNIKKTQQDAASFLDGREDTTAGGTSWERIAKLVDLSGHGARGGGSESGKERFRELLKSLAKDPSAPVASGV